MARQLGSSKSFQTLGPLLLCFPFKLKCPNIFQKICDSGLLLHPKNMQLGFLKNLQAMLLASNIFWILFQQTFESLVGVGLKAQNAIRNFRAPCGHKHLHNTFFFLMPSFHIP
jgi:hypothetical protein